MTSLLDDNGGPDPSGPLNAPYESIAAEVSTFIAKMQERHGVTAILVAYDRTLPENGGMRWEGNPRLVYAMAKKYVIEQESLWANGVLRGGTET